MCRRSLTAVPASYRCINPLITSQCRRQSIRTKGRCQSRLCVASTTMDRHRKPSKPETAPQCSFFSRFHKPHRKTGRRALERDGRYAGDSPTQQAATGGDELQLGLLAVAPLQFLAHVAEAIDEAEFQAACAAPEQAGKDRRIVSQLTGATLAHHGDEDLVDFELQALQVLDILFLFRLERIEDRRRWRWRRQ